MKTSTFGKILLTGLLAFENGLQAFSNPSAEAPTAVATFISELIAVWAKPAAIAPVVPAAPAAPADPAPATV